MNIVLLLLIIFGTEAQITPILGMTSGGTNVSLTLTSQPLPLEDFDLDCAFGTSRVRAALVEVAAVSAGFRSYMLQCKVPAAAEIPRLTKAGCHCKRRWFSPMEQEPEPCTCSYCSYYSYYSYYSY